MSGFVVNGYLWHLILVNPKSDKLVDRTGRPRLGTTDPNTRCVYLSRELKGDFLATVLTHELGHVAMFSYGLLDGLHRLVPFEHWIEAEEWICNFIADYGSEIQTIAHRLMRSEVVA